MLTYPNPKHTSIVFVMAILRMTACVCLVCPAGFGEFYCAPPSNPILSNPHAGIHLTHTGDTYAPNSLKTALTRNANPSNLSGSDRS